jgi:aminoglycoside phosphotransferase (APT) family kinase protein
VGAADLHRAEARTLAALPPHVPAPRLLWTCDDGDWIALGIEDIEGHSPSLPWRRDDLDMVVATLATLARTQAPEGFPGVAEKMGAAFTGWRDLAADPPSDLGPWELRHLDRLTALEASWADHVGGDTLLHLDLRADNLILDQDGDVHIVDWAHACAGAPWVDLVLLLNEVGHAFEDLDEILASAGAPAEGVDALLCAFAGMLAAHCRWPAPPGLPTIRAFQRAYARFATDWLARRTGWDGSVWALG